MSYLVFHSLSIWSCSLYPGLVELCVFSFGVRLWWVEEINISDLGIFLDLWGCILRSTTKDKYKTTGLICFTLFPKGNVKRKKIPLKTEFLFDHGKTSTLQEESRHECTMRVVSRHRRHTDDWWSRDVLRSQERLGDRPTKMRFGRSLHRILTLREVVGSSSCSLKNYYIILLTLLSS